MLLSTFPFNLAEASWFPLLMMKKQVNEALFPDIFLFEHQFAACK